MSNIAYSEDTIQTLEWREHIRKRPGMYIGKLGDGSSPDDGIYVLIKEIMDNSVDEFMMGNGKEIELSISEKTVRIRDYGRGIPLGKVVDVASKMNTGAKYDSKTFQKSVGLNGVGIKAVNALCAEFQIQAFRDKRAKKVIFSEGNIISDEKEKQNPSLTAPRLSLSPIIKCSAIFITYMSILKPWCGTILTLMPD